jgi:hypothetical protein
MHLAVHLAMHLGLPIEEQDGRNKPAKKPKAA